MSASPRFSRVGDVVPRMEALEDRLLLTTLHGGDVMLFQNSSQQTVMMELVGAPTDTIELMGYLGDLGALTDVVGLLNGEVHNWRITDGRLPNVLDANGEWQAIDQQHYGAANEIYSVYVSSCSADTILSIWAGDDPEAPWGSTPPVLFYLGEEAVTAPQSSGGAIVGSFQFGRTESQAFYEAAPFMLEDIGPDIVYPEWAYPGTVSGPLYPGITIVSDVWAFKPGQIGVDVNGLASDSRGRFYYTTRRDLGAKVKGTIWNTHPSAYAAALAADSSGQMYTVENNLTAPVFPPEGESTVSGGLSSLALTTGGRFFATTEGAEFVELSAQDGQPINDARPLLYQNNPWVRMTQVTSLDVDPATGVLYGVAYATTDDPLSAGIPAGPYLITIDPDAMVINYGLASPLEGTAVLSMTMIAAPLDLTEIAFDAAGALYGLVPSANVADNVLYQVNKASAVATPITPIVDAANAALSVPLAGLEFVGGQLYGVLGLQLWRVNVAAGVATAISNLPVGGAVGAAYEHSVNPGMMWTAAGGELVGAPLGTVLQSVNKANGEVAWIAALTLTGSMIAYRDVRAMDFAPDGTLYALGTEWDMDLTDGVVAGSGQMLLTVNPADGSCVLAASLGVGASFESMAINPNGDIYGVNAPTRELAIIHLNGTLDVLGTLRVDGTQYLGPSVEGLEFMPVGNDEALFGIATLGSLWAIDYEDMMGNALRVDVTLVADGTEILGQTGLEQAHSLAYDPSMPGAMYLTASGVGRAALAEVQLANMLYTCDSNAVFQRLGPVVAPGSVFYQVEALEFTRDDELLGIGKVVSLDPYHPIDSDEVGPFLILIDPAASQTVVATTPIGRISLDGTSATALADAKTLACFLAEEQADDLLYLVSGTPGAEYLYLIDPATGLVAESLGQITGLGSNGPTDHETIVSMDFLSDPSTGDNTLFVITSWGEQTNRIYSLNVVSLECNFVVDTGLTNLLSLAGDEVTGLLWSAVNWGDSDRLISLLPTGDPDIAGQDMGDVLIVGTIVNLINGQIVEDLYAHGGDVETIVMGFLWGGVTVGQNIGDLISMTGSGAVLVEEDVYYSHFDSVIWAGKSVRYVDCNGDGDVYNTIAVRAENDPERYLGNSYIQELEYREWPVTPAIMDSGHGRNDTLITAQILSHPSGEFRLTGELIRDDPDRPDEADYYGLPLLAGQTIVIQGYGRVGLTDDAGNRIASFGYETVEDYGVGMGTQTAPLVFTAPAAGIYYIECVRTEDGEWVYTTSYDLRITNGPSAALGGVTIPEHYDGSSVNFPIAEGRTANFAAKNAGGVGAISVGGWLWNAQLYSFGNGPIVAVRAAIVGGYIRPDGLRGYGLVTVYSEGAVGKVYAYDGSNIVSGYIVAFITAGGGELNNNAHVQNIEAATDYTVGIVSATGSIGVIQTHGTLSSVDFFANTDLDGPAGRIDLVVVGYDYGGFQQWDGRRYGVPTFITGPGGDVGYIHVAHEVHLYTGGGWVQLVLPVSIDDGRSTTFTDDSGGRMTVTPQPTQVVDEEGNPVYDEQTGLPVMYTPAYSYIVIGINGYIVEEFGLVQEGGTGAVIAWLKVDGSVTATTRGHVQVSDLEIGGSWIGARENRPTTADVRFEGGQADVYWFRDDAAAFESFSLSASGDIFGAEVTSSNLTAVRAGGNIARIEHGGRAGAWLHGPYDAPTSSDIAVEPQYGWYHLTMNGINAAGDVDLVSAGGSIGDVRVIGTLGTVRADADHSTSANQWDGINGVVWSQTRIVTVHAGDGLIDDGPGLLARAAIMSGNSIGAIYVDGSYHTIAAHPEADINVRLRGPTAYHELNGAIIAFNNQTIQVPTVDELGRPVVDDQGNPVMEDVEVDGIGKVIGTGGAHLTAIVMSSSLNFFQAFWRVGTTQGGIGTVSFSGRHGEIDGAGIHGGYVRHVSTSSDSDGINYTYIEGTYPSVNLKAVGLVSGGGPGIFHSSISASGSIGTITAPDHGDIMYTHIGAMGGVNSISGKDLRGNVIKVSGTIGALHASRDMYDNNSEHDAGGFIGSVDKLSVGRDFLDNDFRIAGRLASMTVAGEFDSVLTMYGPTTAYLKSLEVKGDINGEIVSYGKIGSIVTDGRIDAEIRTVAGGWDTSADLIRAEQGIFGPVTIEGAMGRIESGISLGSDPSTLPGFRSQTINVHGRLGYVRVHAGDEMGHLYANINAGGDIGTLDIDGTLYGEVTTFGNLDCLEVGGGLGGRMDVDNDGDLDDLGWLDIYGAIGSLRFNTSSDLVADLTVGGSLERIAMRNADIRGTLISRYGRFGAIEVTNGRILGDVTAQSIGIIRVRNGDIGTQTQPVTITARRGGVEAIEVYNGAFYVDADVHGRLDLLRLEGASTAAGRTIQADGGIGAILIRNGSLSGNIFSGRDIQRVSISGSQSGILSAQTVINRFDAAGTVRGSIRAGSGINRLTAGKLDGATVSSGRNIGIVKVGGNVTNSLLLAGYDVGPDGAVGGGDDNLLAGAVHSGDIGALHIGGQMDRSVVAAGIDPGDLAAGARQAFLSTADNVEAAGASSIRKMTVRRGFGGTASESGILADSAIDSRMAVLASGAGVVVKSGVNPAADPDTTGFRPFGAGTVNGPTLTVAWGVEPESGVLSLTLAGPGTAYFNDATGMLVLKRTTARSKLTIRNGGAMRTIHIDSADDSALGALTTAGKVKLGNVSIDGLVGKLTVGAAEAGAQWNLPGGVGKGYVGAPGDLAVNTGQVRSWKMGDDFGGSLTADAVGNLIALGDISGNVTAQMGSIRKAVVRGGLGGSLDSYDTIDALSVGSLSGTVSVARGDLMKFKAGGNVAGRVEVARGQTRAASIGGNFSGSYRAAQEIRSFAAARGRFSGVLAVEGDLAKLTVGTMSGRVWSGANIGTVRFSSMNGGLVAASGDLVKARIGRDMTDSYLLAGLEPGDAGYDPANGETGNLALDRGSAPPLAQTDQACGGAIAAVVVGGDMATSTIAAGIDPGLDGYFGTGDDHVNGVGYVGRVKVRYGISGSDDDSADKSYGVFAANSMPTVTSYGHGFMGNGNAIVSSMIAHSALLAVRDVTVTNRDVTVRLNSIFNHATLDLTDTFGLEISTNPNFSPAATTNLSTPTPYLLAPIYDNATFSVTLRLARGSWDTLYADGMGRYLRLVIDGTTQDADGDGAILDTRGRLFDGDDDGRPGGDYALFFGDDPDTLQEALAGGNLDLQVDAGTLTLHRMADNLSDLDIFAFQADAYQFLGVDYQGSSLVQMALLYQDDQGTLGDIRDDTFEAVTRPLGFLYDDLNYGAADERFFQGFELPETGQYLLVLGWGSMDSTLYDLGLTLSSTDSALVAEVGGPLPGVNPIAYVSNAIGDRNNLLGGLPAKQLVFLNFYGGTATKYSFDDNILIGRFDAGEMDAALTGLEQTLIFGGDGVTGVVDNVVSIYRDIPASDPEGPFVVEHINLTDAADWAAYQAADSGLWFTTEDPWMARGLDPETEFTTVFIGSVDVREFPDQGYGVASNVDLGNASQADNTIIFTNNMGGWAYGITTEQIANRTSRFVACVVAHEMGHAFGLSHQPADYITYELMADDPDNNPVTPDDSNQGYGLMSYVPPWLLVNQLSQLGTNILSPREFPLGYSDHVQQLQWWLA